MPDFDVVFRAVFDPIATDTPVVTATPSPTVPITGDEANPMLWMFVMLGALMVLGGMLTTKWLIKKQR